MIKISKIHLIKKIKKLKKVLGQIFNFKHKGQSGLKLRSGGYFKTGCRTVFLSKTI